MDDMLYKPLTNKEIKEDIEENKVIKKSLKPIHIDMNIEIKKNKKNGKKSKKAKLNRKSKEKNKSRKLKLLLKNKTYFKLGGAKETIPVSSEEIEKYGTFLDQISLKTESGILPLFRKFEDNDENILACLFYGFYMRLAINTDKNNYLVKLSKIIAKNKRNYFSYTKEAPELVIYQNLSIDGDKDMTTIGIVSKLTPRIINSFI